MEASGQTAEAHNITPAEGEAALCLACDNGNLAQVRALLGQGVSANAVDKDGYTALINACANLESPDAPQIVRLLLMHGADLEKTDHEMSATALSWAVQRPTAEITRILLHYGANPLRVDSENTTILHNAIYGHPDNIRETIEAALHRFGVDENAERAHARLIGHFFLTSKLCTSTPMHRAAITSSVLLKNGAALRTLIECGMPIDVKDFRRITPATAASWDGSHDGLAILMQAGAKITVDTWSGPLIGLDANMTRRPPSAQSILTLMLHLPQSQWSTSLTPEKAGMSPTQKLSHVAAAMHLGRTDWLTSQMAQSKNPDVFFQECAEVSRRCQEADPTPLTGNVQESFAAVSALKAHTLIHELLTKRGMVARQAS